MQLSGRLKGCSQRQATCGLDHHLHAFGIKTHGLHQLRIGHGVHAVHQAADDLEGDFADHGRLRAVGNRHRGGNAHPLALLQGLLHIVARFGLHAVNLASRRQGFGRQGTAAEQSAAAQAHKQGVELAHLLKQLQRRCALTAQHVRVVKRWNKAHAVLGGQSLGNGQRVVLVAVVTHHFRAIAACGR